MGTGEGKPAVLSSRSPGPTAKGKGDGEGEGGDGSTPYGGGEEAEGTAPEGTAPVGTAPAGSTLRALGALSVPVEPLRESRTSGCWAMARLGWASAMARLGWVSAMARLGWEARDPPSVRVVARRCRSKATSTLISERGLLSSVRLISAKEG